MSNHNPLLTIITVCFNSEKSIKTTIESILSQKTNNFEYIIIDGKSQDNTLEIIQSFKEKFKNKNIPYKYISEPDKGIYDAFNKGLKLANGKWISFLGSDDYYLENALELYSKEIENLKTEVDLVFSNVNLGNRKEIKDKWSWRVFRRKMNIAHVGAFHNKLFFEKYGVFNINYKIAGDYEILLRAKNNLKTHWFNKFTAFMADGGASNNQIIKVYKETKLAKIENKSQNKILIELDYYIWVIKYRVKIIINALIR